MNQNLPEEKRTVVVVSGPSGAGKSTVLKEVFKDAGIIDSVEYSVSATTRPPRPGEEDGTSYHFLTEGKFDEMASGGEFLEWAKVHNHRYGTPKANIAKAFASGKDLLLEIDVQGALRVKKEYPDAALIFITAPPDVFRARLQNRPSNLTGEALAQEIEIRMNTARRELELMGQYDYAVINDRLDESVKKVISIIIAERCRLTAALR